MIEEEKYIVTAWHVRDGYYAFGPFDHKEGALAFMDKLSNLGKFEEIELTVVNAPELAGTGLEVS